MKEQLKITLHIPLQGKQPGSIVYVNAVDGVPTDRYWRKKVKESQTNGCLTVESLHKTPKAKKKAEAKQKPASKARDQAAEQKVKPASKVKESANKESK